MADKANSGREEATASRTDEMDFEENAPEEYKDYIDYERELRGE